jgi:transcription antitermination factor NusG
MMSQLPKNWYAVYTKPLWEKKVAKLLDRKKIESYCPLAKIQRQWSDRKKVLEIPLFTSYVFVHITEEEKSVVRQTEGILNFVHWLKKPAIIKTEEIILIKRFLNEYGNVKLEKSSVNQNDHIRILNGPLMEREGKVLEIKHKTIKVSLPSLGYILIAEIEKSNVEILTLFPREDVAIA